jgi:hypothetical protein
LNSLKYHDIAILVDAPWPESNRFLAPFLPEEEISKQVAQDVRWARDFRQTRVRDWDRFYTLYKNWIDPVEYPYEANLAIPSAYSIVEVQTAFLLSMIFESGDFVEVLGKTPMGQISAKAVKELLNYHFRYSFHTYEDMEVFCRNLLIFGTSIYKVFYEHRDEYKTVDFPILDENTSEVTGSVKREIEVNVRSNPTGYPLNLKHFGVDPNAPDIRRARFAFEEKWPDIYTLVDRHKKGIYNNNVLKLLSRDDQDVNQGLVENLNEIGLASEQMSPFIERGRVHVVDYWGYLTRGWTGGKLSRNAKSQLMHVVMAVGPSTVNEVHEALVLLAEPTPFNHNRLPFVDARINHCVDEFYGTGDLEYCESLLYEQRDNRNALMDNLNRTVHQMWKIKKNSDIDESELTWRPSGGIHVRDMEDLEPVETPRVDAAHFKVQEDIRRDLESATGVNDFVMGQYRSSTGFNDTATGISLIQQTALMRLGQKGNVVQRAIRDIAVQAFCLIQQYQPYGTRVRVMNREAAIVDRFINISPEELSKEYDFAIVNAPALGSKPLRINQLMQLLQIVVQSEAKGGMSEQVSRLYKRIVAEMDMPNPQELFGFPEWNEPLPAQLGEGEEITQSVEPEDENNEMIVHGNYIQPKEGENHPFHIFTHQRALDDPEIGNADSDAMLTRHLKAHYALMQQEKTIVATEMAAEMQLNQANQQAAQMQILSGGKGANRSPTSANGAENAIRGMGNLIGGRAF